MSTFSSSLIRVIATVALLGAMAACQTTLPPVDGGHGPETAYALMLRHFSDREALAIMKAMREEFPGYRSHTLISKTESVRSYEYVTTAKSFKLEEWLYALFRDLGFGPEDTLVEVQRTQLTVDKLAPKPSPSLPPEDRDSERGAEPEPDPPSRDDPEPDNEEDDQWQPVTG